jgi:hypothetical protein
MTEKAKRLGEQPAFPAMYFNQNREAEETCTFEVNTNCGLNKREFFAGLAMQSCISMSKIDPYNAAKIPSLSVVFADALLEELVKEN